MTEETEQTVTETETPANVVPLPEAAVKTGISHQDIATIVYIIDLAAKRGAFEGPELLAVGAYRNKIDAWLKANAPAKPAEGAGIPT